MLRRNPEGTRDFSYNKQNDMKKYLDITKSKTVVIQRRRTDIYVHSTQKPLEPDADLARAISMDELLAGVKEDIIGMYKAGK